jgi:hypothetical protein
VLSLARIHWRIPSERPRGDATLQVIVVHFAAHPPDGKRLYGPGLQAGYQYTARRGFTFMAPAGAGYAIGKEPVAGLKEVRSLDGLAGLGLGYTWR